MDVLMPQLGETVAEGKISKWFVSAGDAVKPGDNLFEIETDKVSMEVPAISAGVIAAIHVQAGQVAPVGAIVAIIQGKDETISTEKPPVPVTPAKAGVQSQEKKELDSRLRGNERSVVAAPNAPRQMEPFREVRSPERNYGPARLSGGAVTTPLARRLAGEAGIDLANVKGSGPRGRIVSRDVETARSTKASALAPSQTITIALTADIEIGRALALCTQANAAQKTALELADVIVKAWATALARGLPTEGIALVVGKSRTVIRGAGSKSLTAISAARSESTTADGQGASTAVIIANVPGIRSITAALQPPQTTTLSIGSPRRAPVEAADGSVKFADMITVMLICDHRVVDGALGAELLLAFKGFVEQPVTMIV